MENKDFSKFWGHPIREGQDVKKLTGIKTSTLYKSEKVFKVFKLRQYNPELTVKHARRIIEQFTERNLN